MKDGQREVTRIVVEIMVINLETGLEQGLALTGENIPSTHAESV